MTAPGLFTFDVFGTVLDWRSGLAEAVAARGRPLAAGEFNRIIDRQGALEAARPAPRYREDTARSLVEVLGLDPAAADAVGAAVGTWPAYPDSAAESNRSQRSKSRKAGASSTSRPMVGSRPAAIAAR